MKLSKAQVRRQCQTIPQIRFEEQQLTSFGGAVFIQALFDKLDIKARLLSVLGPITSRRPHESAIVFLQLVLQLMLGFVSYRDRDAYQGDPLLLQLLGLKRFPDVATISRTMTGAGEAIVIAIRAFVRELVLDRVVQSALRRLTLDFDGSVLSTRRHAEGSAVGFNRHRKGERSYYPLFCTISQLGMLFDFHHRSGNVHDSNGASGFVQYCVTEIRKRLASLVLEVRMDSAFFQEELLDALSKLSIQFSASVPFDRFVALKKMVEGGTLVWTRINDSWDYCESDWKPKCWLERKDYRVVLFRQRSPQQRKGPLQLDLFVPRTCEFDFKAIITNKRLTATALLAFHNGRGVQEAIFGDAKTAAGLGYIPSRFLFANQLFLAASMLAHNLGREFGWQTSETTPRSTVNRAPSESLPQLNTLRKYVFQRAGRLTRPQGRPTLTIGANSQVRKLMLRYIDVFGMAA